MKGFSIDDESMSGINFVGTVVTPWHVIGIKSAISYLEDKGIQPNGIVFIQKHASSGFLVDEDSFSDIQNLKIVKTEFDIPSKNPILRLRRTIHYWKLRKQYLNARNDEALYVLNPWHINIEKTLDFFEYSKDVQNIVFDEGLATYMESDEYFGSDVKGLKKTLHRRRIKKSRLVEKQLKDLGKLEYFTLFDSENGTLKINENVAQYYRKTIEHNYHQKNRTSGIDFTGKVLINTQTYVDDDQISNDEEIAILRQIVEECRNHNVDVVLKPHPREKNVDRFKTLGVELIKDIDLSQEELLVESKPKAIIGFASTTLVTASVLFGIEAFSLNKLIKEDIGKVMRLDVERFNEIFSDYVHIVEQEELNSMLF